MLPDEETKIGSAIIKRFIVRPSTLQVRDSLLGYCDPFGSITRRPRTKKTGNLHPIRDEPNWITSTDYFSMHRFSDSPSPLTNHVGISFTRDQFSLGFPCYYWFLKVSRINAVLRECFPDKPFKVNRAVISLNVIFCLKMRVIMSSFSVFFVKMRCRLVEFRINGTFWSHR